MRRGSHQPEILHGETALPTRGFRTVLSSKGGDYSVLRKTVDEKRQAVQTSRSGLASALDRLGEHHVRQKEFDDAMDAFTEALHEKRSVFSLMVSSHGDTPGSRRRAGSTDAQIDLEDGVDTSDEQNEAIDSIVQTLRNMGNVHSLRGEQDEAMRYYTEVTSLRAVRSSTRDSPSVSSRSKSSLSQWDEDTSTLMSEINEDVKALDDLFRNISFRNSENSKDTRRSRPKPLSPNVNSDKTRKRRRGDGLRQSGENEPFKRSSSMGTRCNNELMEALDIYRSVIDTGNLATRDQHKEHLNSLTLRAGLLRENKAKEGKGDSFVNGSERSPTRVGELNLAMEVYQKILAAQQEIEKDPSEQDETQSSANIASTLIRMGSIYYKLNNVNEELEKYREASIVYRRAFGENHAYVAGTRKNVGMVLAERGEYDEAMEQFEAARRIYLDVNSGDQMNCDVASAISCMGNVKNRMGELDEALSHYLQALNIYKVVQQRESVDEATRDVVATLKVIGMVHTKKGELDTAMDYFSSAMDLLQDNPVASKETNASIRSRIAGIHFKKGEYDQAMMYYQQAHDLTAELRGTNHPDVAGILHYIGGIHHKRAEYPSAMKCYQEAVRIYHATLGPGNPAVAATLVCIGSIHYKQRNLDSAMMFYREALRLNRDAYGLHHPDVAPTLKSIGTILTKKGEYDEAYDVFRDVLSIKCTVHGTGHPEVANAYKSLGNIHYKRGELADAERQYRHALSIYRRTKGEDHPDTLSAKTSIDHIRYWMKERGLHHQNNQQLQCRDSRNSHRTHSDERSC